MNAESTTDEIVAEVVAAGSPERAASAQRFFKTGPGEYGEGDRFLGVAVPVLRSLATRLRGLPAEVVDALLANELHEIRMLALLVLAENYRRADDPASWVEQYRCAVRAGRVNNWDLVDCSAAPILGDWLVQADGVDELLRWAASDGLWERRVGIVATHAFTTGGRSDAILAVAPLVIDDRRDLIQKALGWMLREMGKRVDEPALLDFLETNAAAIGRTALSYAIERLSPDQRKHFRGLS
ncbi:DNA alkylation repair protein [Gordonia hydrophobica]|uniref:DNA alkylation repair protein n=1 Tax=Gordonia hydrophobica TaxID=40516 RepID=A0ABZ2TWS7_9ACTN|nr:DNA alkylation repair protein [Gordonia hydrophobica]MBM7365771.1 3-methyladenine DNA glycosylase AlkD [Gordonia hydrophobica]